MRRAPVIEPRDIVIGCELDPNGAHKLVIETSSGIVGMKFSLDQVAVIERAMADMRTLVVQVDAGADFYTTRFKPLAVA